MSVEAMRAVLKKQYNGSYKWVNRVNNMSEAQVIAVYKRMQGSGQLKN
jgi:hypothetical protein